MIAVSTTVLCIILLNDNDDYDDDERFSVVFVIDLDLLLLYYTFYINFSIYCKHNFIVLFQKVVTFLWPFSPSS